MSIDWFDDAFRLPELARDIQTFQASGFPRASHPAEPDAFVRHEGVPGHRQGVLSDARVLVVGAGGLGSWTDLALIRSGVGHLTIVEPDIFDRTNSSRQLMYGADFGALKATAVAKNLLAHAPEPASITAIPMTFEQATDRCTLPADVAVFLVDNNACRLAGARFCRRQGIPAVFAMLSADAMRTHVFLQGPSPADACVHCALPNLNPESSMPCVSAIITSCLLASAFVTFFVHRALMGWPDGTSTFNWREADLLAVASDRVGLVQRRPDCPTCSEC